MQTIVFNSLYNLDRSIYTPEFIGQVKKVSVLQDDTGIINDLTVIQFGILNSYEKKTYSYNYKNTQQLNLYRKYKTVLNSQSPNTTIYIYQNSTDIIGFLSDNEYKEISNSYKQYLNYISLSVNHNPNEYENLIYTQYTPLHSYITQFRNMYTNLIVFNRMNQSIFENTKNILDTFLVNNFNISIKIKFIDVSYIPQFVKYKFFDVDFELFKRITKIYLCTYLLLIE